MTSLEGKKITLRSVYKVKEYHFQPGTMPNGINFPFVKKVRTDMNGNQEMILSEKELNDPESMYFIAEDEDIVVTDGTTFDLSDKRQANIWKSIEHSPLIVPTRSARDSKGNLIIDGSKTRYGIAELWVEVPGEISKQAVDRRKLILQAYTYINNDSYEGIRTKIKLLGKPMENAPESDLRDYLFTESEKKPASIISLYEDEDIKLKLLLVDAKQKGVIMKKNGAYMYGENLLGMTNEAVVLYLKQDSSKVVYSNLIKEVYPNFNVKAKKDA